MRKNFRLVSACLLLLSCASCSTQPHSVTHPVKSDENLLISSSAAVTSGLLRDSDDIKHYCASVAPDATFNETASEGASISFFNIGRSSPEKEVVSVGIEETQMVGRTPAVLVSREILYRVCELTGNKSFTNQELLKLYEKSIDAIVQLASQEMANTSITLEARSGTEGNGKVSMQSMTDLATAIGSSQQNNESATAAPNNGSYQAELNSNSSNANEYYPSTSTGYTPSTPSEPSTSTEYTPSTPSEPSTSTGYTPSTSSD
jgi:hypothetical protein